MDVSENSGIPKSSILIGFSIINHPFWGTPIFGNTHIKIPACWFHLKKKKPPGFLFQSWDMPDMPRLVQEQWEALVVDCCNNMWMCHCYLAGCWQALLAYGRVCDPFVSNLWMVC